MIVGLPVVIYLLYFLCNDKVCMHNPLSFDWNHFFSTIPPFSKWWSTTGTFIYLGWLAFNVFLERVLPGEVAEGVPLPDGSGTRLKYTLSGHLQFWICLLAMGHAYPVISAADGNADFLFGIFNIEGFRPLRLDLLYDHYVSLISISILFTVAFSLYL